MQKNTSIFLPYSPRANALNIAMALATARRGASTRVADVVVPARFTSYGQQQTEEKSRLVQSGVLVRDPVIDREMQGGGLTFNVPSWRDLDASSEENIADDAAGTPAVPNNVGTDTEVAIRLNRNNSWGASDISAVLAGSDPMMSIASNVGNYWARRLQRLFIAIWTGVFADNTANDGGDYTNDAQLVGAFSGTNFINTTLTMGDSMNDLSILFVHSVVYARMQQNNLIAFIPDARGETTIPTYQGRQVIFDDMMPFSGNIYESWLFGPGAMRWGVGTPDFATVVDRDEKAHNGSGEEVLHNRVMWTLHPTGHAYTGPSTRVGGPNIAEFQVATSWNRVYQERKQIKVARLLTDES